MDPLFDSLNPAQREAVRHVEGPLLVLDKVFEGGLLISQEDLVAAGVAAVAARGLRAAGAARAR